MSRNGAGIYTAPVTSFPVVANTLIESAKFNNIVNDIASALSSSIAADGQTIVTADIPLNSHKLTGLAAGSGAGHSVEYAQMNTAIATAVATLSSFKNRFINPRFTIDQRNSGAAQTITAGAALAYTVDKWFSWCTGANVTGQQVASGSSDTLKQYKFTGAASVTGINFAQRIAGIDSYDLAGKTCTLSVEMANSLLTTVTWTAYYANSLDAFGSIASPTKTQIATGTFTVSSTDARYSAQIAVPTNATNGIEIVFSVGAQTSGTWTIEDAQLEPGSVVTRIEDRMEIEKFLCQAWAKPITAWGSQITTTAGAVYADISGMRSTPSSSTGISISIENVGVATSPAVVNYNFSSSSTFRMQVSFSAAGASGNPIYATTFVSVDL